MSNLFFSNTSQEGRIPVFTCTRWLRLNLLSSWSNALITLFVLLLLVQILPPTFQWLFVDATWDGNSRRACEMQVDGGWRDAPGACWTFIKVRAPQLFFGLHFASNTDQLWRPITMFIIFFISLFILLAPTPRKIKMGVGLFMLFAFPFIAIALIHGAWLGLPVAETQGWGGFLLTFVIASVGIVVAFPIGIIMALGRRSSMPIIRSICIVYIESCRAAPLITLLFMASNLLPLFLPEGVHYDKLVRALIVITAFQSAYMAEAIRGGLQAIDKGQYEAADSLGLGYWRKMNFIVLPQALKISIPGIVNSAVELFKDTTLIGIIGLLDFLQMALTAARSSQWKGYDFEGFAFIGIIYFICCFCMSQYSQRLEKKLDTNYKHSINNNGDIDD